jgi:hypothetical protein
VFRGSLDCANLPDNYRVQLVLNQRGLDPLCSLYFAILTCVHSCTVLTPVVRVWSWHIVAFDQAAGQGSLVPRTQ